jgi:hypothetical protein
MQDSAEKSARQFFKVQADAEGISLRAYCKKHGIIYESFFGHDELGDVPDKVYLSQLLPRAVQEGEEPADDQ